MSNQQHEKPIKVTISDPETGAVLDEQIVSNDYMLICAGKRYVKNIQIMGRTHMIAIASNWPVTGR